MTQNNEFAVKFCVESVLQEVKEQDEKEDGQGVLFIRELRACKPERCRGGCTVHQIARNQEAGWDTI